MPLPASGPISFNNINVELGVSGTTQASLGQTSYRNLAGVPSGQISMSNFYGKANQFAFTISSNQTNANLRTLAVNAGWNQASKVVATIGSGVYISSNSTGTPALTVNGSFPGGVELVNSGFVVGMGGNGANGGYNPGVGPSVAALSGANGSSGGLALSASVAITINNAGTIAGGGGGGGGGGGNYNFLGKGYSNGAGGGGGGGRSSNAANSSGGTRSATSWAGSATGGAGTVSAAGSGTAGSSGSGGGAAGSGGGGGAWGSSGSSGQTATNGTTRGNGGSGGGAGGAVTGNSNITWAATGTRLGSIT